MTENIRFGVVAESVPTGRAWSDHARRIEDAGVSALLLRDHFSAGAFGQQWAPFSALGAASAVTTRLRVGTMVACNDFRHPAVLAHEAATLHHLSGGRFELGLGAGWYQPEYAAAGIAFDRAGRRISRLEESLGIISGLLSRSPVQHAGEAYTIDGLDLDVVPASTSRPRMLIGAGGPRMLRLAARYADIVGLLPAPITNSTDSDEPTDRTPEALEQKLEVLRTAAGARFREIELSAFGMFVLTPDRRAATEELIARRGWNGIKAESVWQMPSIFVGSADQVRADLHARRERFGLTYYVTCDKQLATIAEIIAGP